MNKLDGNKLEALHENDVAQFTLKIESLVKDCNMTYMEAVIHYCEENKFELELAAKLISGKLKSDIKHEAEALNFLPKSKVAKLKFN